VRPLTSVLLTLSLAAAAACGSDDRRPTFDDPAQPVTVSAGSEFALALKSNQSTGYQWVLVDSAALGPLRMVGKEYTVPREHRDANGAGGTETWTFAAPAPGEATLDFVYKRPWETIAPTDSATFHVRVR